jgi:hypothetical protein
MNDVLTRDLVAYDPLSEVTRKERKALLGVAVIGIALAEVPLVPTKLSAFGLEFSTLNQRAFLALYAVVVAYFLIAFLVYAFTDYVAWKRSQAIHYREYLRQDELVRKSLGVEVEEEAMRRLSEDGCPYRGFASYRTAKFASGLRAAFEFLVPLATAIYAIVVMLTYVPRP